MDRNCPEFLCDTAEGGVRDSEDLIRKWHKQGRAMYAITPRFAPTSTEAQLRLTGRIGARLPGHLHPDPRVGKSRRMQMGAVAVPGRAQLPRRL
ncbi:hypothetical protein LP420_11570 [Massilia sp. B-10]|nr:hypothetical protein LP420_11570 [Massilia sp. B-10]